MASLRGLPVPYTSYMDLYNNQINARAVIGLSAVGYFAGKPTENRASSECII